MSNNYFDRHWRGELSLGVSFWVNGVLVTLLFVIAEKSLAAREDSMSIRLYAALALASFGLALLITTWQYAGIWRAASNDGSIWAVLAKVGVRISAVGYALLLYHSYLPQCGEMISILQGDSGLPPYKIWALPGGTKIEFSGGIRAGCSEELENVLADFPQAKVLEIETPGGRIFEAKRMMQLVRNHNLNTYTAEKCLSAGTLVLMSGKERFVGVRARVGFHAGRMPGATGKQQQEMNDLVRTTMESAGVSDEFIDRVLETPSSSMWFPTFKQMLDAGVVTHQAYGDPFARKFPPKDSTEWQNQYHLASAEVMATYPDIGVANSPLNKAFVEEYKYQEVTDPAFLDNPEFPLEIMRILQSRQPDLVPPVTERGFAQ